MAETKNVFDELFALNVNEHVEKKNTGKVQLSYLSWSWAWAEVKKRYPEASYEIKMFDGKPYSYDELTGYMCFTSVTIEGVTHDMWLPVMDSHNAAMLSKAYEVKTKYGKGLTNFGIRPTLVNNNEPVLETHILNFDGDIYGENLEIKFVKMIRPEKKFNSADELKEQIAKDLQQIKQ